MRRPARRNNGAPTRASRSSSRRLNADWERCRSEPARVTPPDSKTASTSPKSARSRRIADGVELCTSCIDSMQNDRWLAWFCKSRLPTMKKSFDRFQLNGDDPHPTTLDDDPTIDRTTSVDAHTGATRSRLSLSRAVRGLKTIVAVGAVIAAAGLGLWAYSSFPATPVRPAVVLPPSVAVAMPVLADVVDWTDLTGQFSAVNQVVLRAQVSGYLTEIHFKDGQIVHKGDLLFVIDPRPYEIRLEQAKAALQTATARVALASNQLSRAQLLKRTDFATQETVDQRTNEQDASKAAVEDAKARVQDAELDLEYCRVLAPFTGRIGARQVSLGSLVAGSRAATSPTTLLATLVSLDPLYLA